MQQRYVYEEQEKPAANNQPVSRTGNFFPKLPGGIRIVAVAVLVITLLTLALGLYLSRSNSTLAGQTAGKPGNAEPQRIIITGSRYSQYLHRTISFHYILSVLNMGQFFTRSADSVSGVVVQITDAHRFVVESGNTTVFIATDRNTEFEKAVPASGPASARGYRFTVLAMPGDQSGLIQLYDLVSANFQTTSVPQSSSSGYAIVKKDARGYIFARQVVLYPTN